MKILSLNINDFGGALEYLEKYKKVYQQSAYSKWDKLDKSRMSSQIFSFIQSENPAVAILHEFDLNSDEAKNFKAQMQISGYALKHTDTELKRPSMTVVFVKEELHYPVIENPHERAARAIIIKVENLIVYGVHCPTDTKFWDELIGFYDNRKESKILIIGDLNVFDPGTPEKTKYCELLNLGAKDVWIEKGFPHEKATFNSGKRIDYALMSPSLFSASHTIRIDDSLRSQNITDHSAIIVEV